MGRSTRHLRGASRSPLVRALVAFASALPLPALAHETGLSFLRVRVDGASLAIEVDLGLGDAAAALGIDATRDPNADPEVARAQLFARIASRGDELERRVREALDFWQDGAACVLSEDPAPLGRAEETGDTRVRLAGRCPQEVGVLGLEWRLPFANDPKHRALVSVAPAEGGAEQSAILSARRQRVDLGVGKPGPGAAFATYLVEGVRHIGTGPDHMLFLIALLLPAPLASDGGRRSLRGTRATVLDVVRIVTAFTIAHSITLGLSVMGAVALPATAVEAAIALSVGVAALNGALDFLPGRAWQIAFAFGLLHGLGFARYLNELGLPIAARASALFAFNVGVEIGQLAVVAACLPLLLVLGRRRFYREWLLPTACFAIAAVAAVWLLERVSGWTLLDLAGAVRRTAG